MIATADLAPTLDVMRWFNTPRPRALADLRGRVVVLHAFQMLYPGCVQGGLPQAQRTPDSSPQKRSQSSGSTRSSNTMRR